MLIKIFDTFIFGYFVFYLSLFVTSYSFIFKKGIANIAGFTVGLFFILLTRYLIGKRSFSQNPVVKLTAVIYRLSDKVILSLSAVALFITLSTLSIARHFALGSGASDLGIFDQAIWNTLNGDVLFSSLKNNMSLLGDHFEPILFVPVALYKIWPDASVLLILQSALLASAVIPLYLIAKDKGVDRKIIFALIISFLLSRPLRGVGFSDFHPEGFILPFLFWAYYFLTKNKIGMFFISVILLFCCKEDTAFLVCGLGIFAFFFERKRALGLLIFILSILFWVFATKVFLPFFNPLGRYPYMDRLPFGMIYADNIKAVVTNPKILIGLFFTADKIEYCLKMFAPLDFLSLLSPSHYILFGIPMLKNLLANNQNYSGFFNITSHYTAAVIPFTYISAASGAFWLVNKQRRKVTTLIISLLIIFTSLMFYSKTDAHKFSRYIKEILTKNTLGKINYLRIIPRSASLATNFNLVPHASHRKYIYEFNPNVLTSRMTEYVAIDLSQIEYFSASDKILFRPYLDEVMSEGYQVIFTSRDSNFFILCNPKVNKSLVKSVTPLPK